MFTLTPIVAFTIFIKTLGPKHGLFNSASWIKLFETEDPLKQDIFTQNISNKKSR